MPPGFCPLCKARANSVRYQGAGGFCQRSEHGPEPLAVLWPMRGCMPRPETLPPISYTAGVREKLV
jgi:hypothetical protein